MARNSLLGKQYKFDAQWKKFNTETNKFDVIPLDLKFRYPTADDNGKTRVNQNLSTIWNATSSGIKEIYTSKKYDYSINDHIIIDNETYGIIKANKVVKNATAMGLARHGSIEYRIELS